MPISMIQFVFAVTLFNTLWAIAWSKDSLVNMLIKVVFWALAIYGWFLVFKAV